MRRLLNAGAAAAALGAVLVAQALQVAWALQPCTMCILQRYVFLGLAVVFSARAAGAAGWSKVTRWIATILAVAGMLASVKIWWAIAHPGAACGRDAVAAFLNELAPAVWWPSLFEATGVCGDSVPPVLGVPFYAWSLILFTSLIFVAWFPNKVPTAKR